MNNTYHAVPLNDRGRRLSRYIERLMRKEFYGIVSIKFESGQIMLVETTQKLKADELPDD